MPNTFRKHQRIHDSKEVLILKKTGTRIPTQKFLVYIKQNQLKYPRLAIAVTKRAGSSVVRNYAKRRIREFFRAHQHLLGKFDYYFFTGKNLNHLSRKDWQMIVNQLKEKLCHASSTGINA